MCILMGNTTDTSVCITQAAMFHQITAMCSIHGMGGFLLVSPGQRGICGINQPVWTTLAAVYIGPAYYSVATSSDSQLQTVS